MPFNSCLQIPSSTRQPISSLCSGFGYSHSFRPGSSYLGLGLCLCLCLCPPPADRNANLDEFPRTNLRRSCSVSGKARLGTAGGGFEDVGEALDMHACMHACISQSRLVLSCLVLFHALSPSPQTRSTSAVCAAVEYGDARTEGSMDVASSEQRGRASTDDDGDGVR